MAATLHRMYKVKSIIYITFHVYTLFRREEKKKRNAQVGLKNFFFEPLKKASQRRQNAIYY